MKPALPYIAIIGIGAFAGNMINIGMSYGLHWMSIDPSEFMTTFGDDFPLLLGPTVATLLPAFLATIVIYLMSKKSSQARRYWLYALVGLAIINIQTIVFHLPLNLAFIDESIDSSNVENWLYAWLFSHWIRVIIAIAAGYFAIRGLVSSQIEH